MKFCYINARNPYPMNEHLINGLAEEGHDIIEIKEEGQGLKKYTKVFWKLLKGKKECNAIIIGYPLPLFAVLANFLTTKKIIFNAVASQYEANIISRNMGKRFSFTAFKYWLIDFLAFHLSSKILLESNSQINFINKLFFVSKNKLIRSWSGVNEKEFFYDSSFPKKKKFTVLFRGRFLPESGILTVIKAAKKLEEDDIDFLVLGAGFFYKEVNQLIDELSPKNLTMISETLSFKELRGTMSSCHISLGQLAVHPRLSRTLPCKLFESLALKLPYITGRNAGVLELLKENETCIAINPDDPNDLARKIFSLKKSPEVLNTIAKQGYELYKNKLTSKQLAKEFIKNCF